MVGRKLSTYAIAASFVAAGLLGGCRDDATTGPANVPSKDYAANIKLLAGDVQNGAVALPLPQQLSVKVVDAGGRPVQGSTVNWVVINGGGSVNPPTGVSDATGRVSTTWTLGTTLGANTVRAYLSNSYLLDSLTFTAAATNGSGVIIKLNAATRPPATAPVATQLTATSFTVLDQFDHPVPGATINFTPGMNSGTVAPAQAITGADGTASVVWTTGTVAGQQSLNAAIDNQLPVTTTLNATPDTSRRIAIVSGNSQVAPVSGQFALPLTVRVTDRFNNVIANDAVVFNDSLGSGTSVNPATATTDASGLASTTWKVGALAGQQTLRVRTPGSGGQVIRFNGMTTVTFRDVFAGDFYTCGVSTSDLAYCWGNGSSGQLGTFAIASRNAPNWPVVLAGGDTIGGPYPAFREISGGKAYACGTGINRTVFCWGDNPDRRQFIEPTSTGSGGKAVDVSRGGNVALNPLLASVSLVSAGEAFSCAVTLGGIAMCAGNNEVGQLGSGVFGGLLPTVLVDTVTVGTPKRYAMVAAGERHACAMPRFDANFPTATRNPWCWGQNNNGQLGDGLLTFADSASPRQVNMTPVPGAAFETLSLVSGSAHSCALTPIGALGGAAFCWGSNEFGQLGSGGATGPGVRSAAPQAVVGGLLFARLYAGENFTCGLTISGVAYCWGINNSSQLGVGIAVGLSSAPAAVAGGLTFRGLALGENHACGITGTTPGPVGTTGQAGVLYCWGDNEYGQAGLGIFGASGFPIPTPTRVVAQQ